MAKVSLSFDSKREEAAAAKCDPTIFDRIITDYLASQIEADMLCTIRAATGDDRLAILDAVDGVKAKQAAALEAAALDKQGG